MYFLTRVTVYFINKKIIYQQSADISVILSRISGNINVAFGNVPVISYALLPLQKKQCMCCLGKTV